MIIIISSKIGRSEIAASLGKPEYSYYFLLKEFVPALTNVATVIHVQSTEEIDTLYASYRMQGEQVVFISVSPPHQTPLFLNCPTITLFAWEFDSLPSVAWDDNPKNDWSYVFSHIAGAICTSMEAENLVNEKMLGAFPVISLPAPIWNRYSDIGSHEGLQVNMQARGFNFTGVIFDSSTLGLSADGLIQDNTPPPASISPSIQPTLQPGIKAALQFSLALLKGWWNEINQFIEQRDSIHNQAYPSHIVDTTLVESTESQIRRHFFSGVVYITVLNPADSRKNWVEIITAFCWAFRLTKDATLIVKMTHHDLEYYRIILITLLSRLAPFECRVIVLHGFLDDTEYRALIEVSTYYVNASSGEGLCLPLMEFLSAGKPAIAPSHSAMSDYVNEQIAFILKCSQEPFCWPHDPTGIFNTHRHRLNWQSLTEAFIESYDVAKLRPEKYRDMSKKAYTQMKMFASVEAVSKPMEQFLRKIAEKDDSPSKSEITQS